MKEFRSIAMHFVWQDYGPFRFGYPIHVVPDSPKNVVVNVILSRKQIVMMNPYSKSWTTP